MENQQPKKTHWSEIKFAKIRDGRPPPFLISIFGHNLVINQIFAYAGSKRTMVGVGAEVGRTRRAGQTREARPDV